MVTEHMQAQFETMRQQSQRLIAEAKDVQMQLAGLDNVLRHEDHIKRSYARLDQIGQELKQQRAGLNIMDKRLGICRPSCVRKRSKKNKISRNLPQTLNRPMQPKSRAVAEVLCPAFVGGAHAVRARIG